MKLWQKILLGIVVVFMLKACFGGKGHEESVRHTTTAQAVAAEANKPDPLPGFLVEQKDKGVIMRFECINPSVKGSGFNFVYRDYAGNILDNTGYKTYWGIRSSNQPVQPNEWLVMEDAPAGKYPKTDAFLLVVWKMKDQLANKQNPVVVDFVIAKSRTDASNSNPMTMTGDSVVYVAAAASNNPCFVLTEK